MTQSARRRLVSHLADQARELAHQWTGSVFGGAAHDTVAQAAVCAAPILASCRIDVGHAIGWLQEQLADWESIALEQATRISTECDATQIASISPDHVFDTFLHQYAPDRRKRGGVFFTPQPIADYIVRRIDARLTEDFGLTGGLADDSAFRAPHSAFLLDPACGTGVFLLAVLDFLHSRLANRWNEFVPQLLPRLIGIEILPVAAFLAKLNIALKLAATGYDFRRGGRIRIECGDALDPSLQFAIRNLQFAIPLILGNPPFSSLSTNTNAWIARLVRGDDEVRGYVQANGQRLNERKTWLHDDYVKFLRLAQWHVERAGCGVVGFVTNHGYLSNATFRLMRQELLRVFPRIEILDLHGNRKAHEIAPCGGRDANVFGLEQGVAISIFSRPPELARSASEGISHAGVKYGELWGARDAKLAALDVSQSTSDLSVSPSLALRASVLVPYGPEFRFTPSAPTVVHSQYQAAWSLAEAMPINATAPVTARDHFVVAFTEADLHRRIEEFRDLSIPDDEIRRRYFQRTRSARYQTGDTRGWKLAAARRTVAADVDWPARIVRCLYRPFDWRYVFWHPAMIDWPRTEVTRHLIEGSGFRVQGSAKCGMWNGECQMGADETDPRTVNPEPFCLIARRQQLPSQPCTFFWISDGLALDGVIRSDNRGSESLFPLYLCEQAGWRANFAPRFVEEWQRKLRLEWLPLGRGDLGKTFGPEDLLSCIYALFHSPSYRQDYAHELRNGFPRVLLPQGKSQFAGLSRLGRELIDLHLLRGPASALDEEAISDDVAAFRAGGYVALRKWLQPAHRSKADPEYRRISAAIADTLERMRQIERVIGERLP